MGLWDEESDEKNYGMSDEDLAFDPDLTFICISDDGMNEYLLEYYSVTFRTWEDYYNSIEMWDTEEDKTNGRPIAPWILDLANAGSNFPF